MEQIFLKEDGDQILLETGDAMLLEQAEFVPAGFGGVLNSGVIG